jgi:TPR repeat protein
VFHKEVGQGLIWLGEQLGGVPESSSPAAIPANNMAPRIQSEQPAATQSDPSVQPQQQTLQPTNTTAPDGVPEEQDTAVKSNAQPMTPLSGVAPPISSSPDTGQNEYTQALQLRRTKGAAAMQEILRLLWVSVEKGNANAELELAQMYWHGQGVIQNCDQAHILLTAAARKGSAEAQRRLVEFQRAGCE